MIFTEHQSLQEALTHIMELERDGWKAYLIGFTVIQEIRV